MSEEITTLPKLGAKQQKFVEAYLGPANCNAYKAAKLAGYTGSYSTIARMGSENLQKPPIAAHISAGLETLYMTRSEVLAEIAAIARADIQDAIDDEGNITVLSLKTSGNGHLIKSHKRTPNAYGEMVSFELYDKQAALTTMAKHLGLLNDKMELSGKVEVDATVRAMSDAELDAEFEREVQVRIDELVAAGKLVRV